MLFAANTAFEQIVIAGALRLRFLYCIYVLRMYTNTTGSIEAEQRLCSKAMISEVGLLQTFRGYKKWIQSRRHGGLWWAKHHQTKLQDPQN